MNEYKKENSEPGSNDEIDLLEMFGVLFDARWFIVLLTVFFTLMGFFYAFSSTPIFKADALIQVEKQDKAMAMFGMDLESSLLSASSGAEIEIFKSRMVLGKTVEQFDLTTVIQANYSAFLGQRIARLMNLEIFIDVNNFDVPDGAPFEMYSIIVLNNVDFDYSLLDRSGRVLLQGKVGEQVDMEGFRLKVERIDAKEGDSFLLWQRTYLDAIDWLKNSIRFDERGNKSGIYQISFEGINPPQNRRLLDNVIQHYFEQNINRNSAEAEKSLIFLKKSIPEVKDNLTQAEDKLNEFRQKNAAINLNLEAKSILDVMVKVEEQLKELAFKENEMDQRYTPAHPFYRALIDNRKTLLKEQEKLGSMAHQLPEKQREILRLTRDFEVNQQIYLLLLKKTQELQIVKASTVGNVRILDKAESHSKALKPNKSLIILLFMLMGALFGIVFSFLKSFYRKGIENPKQIESLGLPVYASIPLSDLQTQIDHKHGVSLKGSLLADECPSDLAVEALRTLRTNLHFLMIKSKNNVLMISGSHSEVGKSFVSANISAVIAKAGLNVLLIDADMRKGSIAQYYGLRPETGLSELLSQKNIPDNMAFQDVLKSTCTENLSIVTRGSIPLNPSELLIHARFGAFIRWASEQFDLVIIDTPPILAVTDASIIGAHAGMTVLVARFSVTKVKELQVTRDRFFIAGIEVDGVILNGIERRSNNEYAVNYTYKYQ